MAISDTRLVIPNGIDKMVVDLVDHGRCDYIVIVVLHQTVRYDNCVMDEWYRVLGSTVEWVDNTPVFRWVQA